MPRAIISPSVLASDFRPAHRRMQADDQGRRRMAAHGRDGRVRTVCALKISPSHSLRLLLSERSHFVPNITMGAPVLACVSKGVPGIFMDCHMMVSQPEKWVDDIADAGGSLYCFHLEATSARNTSYAFASSLRADAVPPSPSSHPQLTLSRSSTTSTSET
ncbi:hypothetical protein NUW54_g9788 [Trametes sanguinea]|uniref:Uncharacterized protein n=1 Tax=Trametes sanguinea TaxID=158606 RepID=A0ACC1P3G9_9APHY|nr:hypothetical protein NUW54_g9788 [Trametes sanguinea]